jgi:bacteriorhodopsin
LAFLLAINQLVYKANQTQPRHLDNTTFVIALFAFLAYVGIWTVRLVVYFSRTKK